ncbi:unnamed protein product [Cutaneotrichosporon oleaginosum]
MPISHQPPHLASHPLPSPPPNQSFLYLVPSHPLLSSLLLLFVSLSVSLSTQDPHPLGCLATLQHKKASPNLLSTSPTSPPHLTTSPRYLPPSISPRIP